MSEYKMVLERDIIMDAARIKRVLAEARAFMRKNHYADWNTYSYFKLRVGWVATCKMYDDFIDELCRILRI